MPLTITITGRRVCDTCGTEQTSAPVPYSLGYRMNPKEAVLCSLDGDADTCASCLAKEEAAERAAGGYVPMFATQQTFSTVLTRTTPDSLVADLEIAVEITGWFDGVPCLGAATVTADAPLYREDQPTGNFLFREHDEIELDPPGPDGRRPKNRPEEDFVRERAQEYFTLMARARVEERAQQMPDYEAAA